MKVTPIVAGSGALNAQINQGSMNPSRKEAAEKAFMGQEHAVTQQNAAQIPRENLNVHKIKMNTNASPDRFNQEILEQAQTPTTSDESKQETTIEHEVTRPISPQLAEVARRQRALQVRERELAAKEKEFLERSSSGTSIELDKIKGNALGLLDVIKQSGVPYEELANVMMAEASGVSPEVLALKEKVAELEKGFENKLTERDAQAEKQILAELRKETDILVSQSGDEYEAIRGTNSQKKVVDLIHKTWQKTGEVLDVQEAAKLIEQELIEDARKYIGFKKAHPSSEESANTQQVAQSQQPQLKTLTNRNTASVPLSRKARAMAAFNGSLK